MHWTQACEPEISFERTKNESIHIDIRIDLYLHMDYNRWFSQGNIRVTGVASKKLCMK